LKYDIATIGDATKDIFVFPSEEEMEKPLTRDGEKFLLLEHGDKITISDIKYCLGGSANNVAIGLAQLGLKSGIVSLVGHDTEGQEIMETLKKAGVNTEYLDVSKEKKTSFSVIIVYQGERTILVFQIFQPVDFHFPKNLETDWLYVGPLGDHYNSLYAQITGLAAEKNIKIALNPGSVQIHDGLNAFGGLLRVAKILFVNREEGQKLAGIGRIASVKEITEVLLKSGPETVVVTDGKEGAFAATLEDFFKVGAYPSNRLETTGAGDAFASAFMAAHIKGEKLFDCLKWGVVNSASVIEKVGAQAGLLKSGAIKKRIKEYRWPAETLRFAK